jgi:hypothetical protein
MSSLHIINYNPELLTPAFKPELLKDLSARTGQNIEKVKIIKIDFSKGQAEIVAYFRDNSKK